MHVPFVDLKVQYSQLRTEINSAVQGIFDDATFVGGQPIVDFEQQFAKTIGAKHVVAVGNGTDAIYIVLKMLGIQAGDEVITTATSWISTSETISQTGAKPVFIDVDPDYYTIDVNQIESRISGRTKAILPVHLYGQMANMSVLKSLCEKHALHLIEDCAQSHFSSENDRYAGLHGIAGTFSFYPGKNLGAYGDAGCIVTNNDQLALKCRMYANHGALVKHQHEIEGINSRMDTVQAAVLNVKLKHIDKWNKERILRAELYTRGLRDVPQVVTPKVRAGTVHTFHVYAIRVERRDELKKFLEQNGIQVSIHYPTALPNLPAYKHLGHSKNDFPIASQLQDEFLSLPMYPELEPTKIEYVCKMITKFYQNH